MSILTALAGNLLGNVAEKASETFLGRASQTMSNVGFERIFNNIGTQKLSLEDMQLSAEEKADILDLIGIAKQGDMSDFELEIHGQLYSIDTNNLELTPVL